MLQDIIDSINGFIGVMKKDSCYEALSFLRRSIENDLIPALKDMISKGDNKFIKNNDLLSEINRMANIKASDNVKALEKILVTFETFIKNYGILESLVDKYVETNVTSKTMSIKTGAIIKILQDLMSMTSYTLDLLYYVLLSSEKVVSTSLPRVKLKQIIDAMPTYCEMYSIYSVNFNNTLKKIAETSEEKIQALIEASENNENNSEWVFNTVINKTGAIPKLPNARGFIGNPIYHFRMWLVDRDIKKYESLKTKKQLIELKIMELKLKQNNENDPSLTKSINYYEDQLAKIEYEIAKIEK